MGIARGAARLLIAEASRSPFTGIIGQLGRQTMYHSSSEFIECAKLHDFSLQAPVDRDDSYDDAVFFKALGFDQVESVDVSAYQGTTHVVDLNKPVSEDLHNRFDVIYDGGTTEHIFDQVSVMKNIHSMLKIGGRIIHASPSTGHVDHGYYMFSPTMFWEYYTANFYSLETAYVIKYNQLNPAKKKSWNVYDYTPGSLWWASVSFKGSMALFFVSRKTADSTSGIMPHQGKFGTSWTGQQSETTGDTVRDTHGRANVTANAFSTADLENLDTYVSASDNRNARRISSGSRLDGLKLFIKRNKVLFKTALFIRHKLPFGKMPPKVAKY